MRSFFRYLQKEIFGTNEAAALSALSNLQKHLAENDYIFCTHSIAERTSLNHLIGVFAKDQGSLEYLKTVMRDAGIFDLINFSEIKIELVQGTKDCYALKLYLPSLISSQVHIKLRDTIDLILPRLGFKEKQ